mmetsp:Transcript_16618/g.36522  ORF Transcript_16618/g.36522 Transcript_16618/m.36522 type:complete len:165 (+) Transcript_16618:114-608(+)
MFAGRLLRSTKMLVGISIKDVEGGKAAIRRAISLAKPGDKITALHIPTIVPEMMLSSMSDPGDASEDTFLALANLPSKAGATVQQNIKVAASEAMREMGKDVDITYTVTPPAGDVKSSLLHSCKEHGAGLLVLGSGPSGNGSVPVFAAGKAKGVSVLIVRDHIE